MTVRGYTLAVDWSRNGSFTGPLGDVSGYVLDQPELEISFGRERTQAAADTSAGKLTFALRNDERLFSPENASSPIVGKIAPGCRARFDKLHNGTLYTLFDGVLDECEVDPAAPANDFTATVLDAWGRPNGETLSTPLYSGIRTGTAIELVLDAIGWTGGRDVDPGATVMPWWWEEGTDAATAVDKLVRSEGPPAIAYVQGGTFFFRDRHHRITDARSNTGAATIASYDFEAGVADYNNANGCTITSTTAQARTGARSGLMTVVGSPPQAYVRPTVDIGVNVGRQYRATMWVYSPTATTVLAALDWSNASGYLSGSYPSFAVPATTWTQLTVSATAPAGATRTAFGPTLTSPTAGTLLYLDDVTFEQVDATQGTFTHITPTGTGPTGDFKVLEDSFMYNHGLRHIANTVTFSVQQRAAGDLVEVWSTDTPIVLAAGESTAIEASAPDPFFNAVAPVADVDYELQFGTVTVGLSRTSGQSALITLTAGGTPAQLNRLALRANPVPVVRTVKVSEEDASSIGAYGRQAWPVDAPWANVLDARSIAQRIVSTYATNRPVVQFKIDGVLSGSYLTQVLARQISDRITVRNDELGVNRDFIIERIAHAVSGLGTRHTVEFTCEVTDPLQPSNVFTFNVAGLGFDQGAFGAYGIDSATTMFRFDTAGQGFNQGTFAS